MPYRTTLSLVVRQTRAVHEEIADLLGQLRRANNLTVRIQMKLVQIPEDDLLLAQLILLRPDRAQRGNLWQAGQRRGASARGGRSGVSAHAVALPTAVE